METARCGNVRIETETGPDIHPLDRLKVIHLVRDIFTGIQIVDGLTIRGTTIGLSWNLERRNSILGLETPVTNTPTKFRGHYFQIKIVSIVVCWGCHEVGVTTGNRPLDGWQVSLALGRGRLVTLTVSKSLSGIYKTHDCCKSKWIHY
jgi:hypothetical protein